MHVFWHQCRKWTVVGSNYWFLWYRKWNLMQKCDDIYIWRQTSWSILKRCMSILWTGRIDFRDEIDLVKGLFLCIEMAMKPVVLILSSCAVCQWLPSIASHMVFLSSTFAFSDSISHLQNQEESCLNNKFLFHHTVTGSETWALPNTK